MDTTPTDALRTIADKVVRLREARRRFIGRQQRAIDELYAALPTFDSSERDRFIAEAIEHAIQQERKAVDSVTEAAYSGFGVIPF